jgi:hypothetical protein
VTARLLELSLRVGLAREDPRAHGRIGRLEAFLGHPA